MNISKDHSHKIRVFYLILIMMVLYFHGYYNEAEPFPVAQAVQVIGSGNGLWCVANTLFFLLSGLLFFNGIESVKGCYPNMKKLVHSLLVLYLIWNVIFILWPSFYGMSYYKISQEQEVISIAIWWEASRRMVCLMLCECCIGNLQIFHFGLCAI